MKKSKLLVLLAGCCILALSAGAAACTVPEEPNVESGESTTLATDKSPDRLTPENAVYAFLQKQRELDSYVITTEGTAVADLLGYRQEVHNTTYKNGEDYLSEAQSSSFLVTMKHQSFSKGGKVVYRNSFDGEMQVAEKADYKKVYGVAADDVSLGGYIINARTIRLCKLEKAEGDTFTYYLCLAGDRSLENGAATESATAGLRLQAREFGSLDNLPAYSDVDVRLTIKKDWTPVSYTSTCSYDAKKIFDMSVTQSLTCTYSEVNGTVTIPDVDAFNAKIGSTPSAVLPAVKEEEPLMALATAFGNTLDEKNGLTMPLSFAAENLLGAPIDGTLALKLSRDALDAGNVADALTFRLDIDLTSIPLLGGLANTLTVRCPGEGLLLVMLNNRAEDKDNYLFTYAAETDGLTSSLGGDFTIEGLRDAIDGMVSVEKTDAGYTLTLKDAPVQALDAAYQGLLSSLAQTIGDTHGYLASFFGAHFTGLEISLTTAEAEGKTVLTGLAADLAATPAENVTMGEKIGISLDTMLVGGAIEKPITGDLLLRLFPEALRTGDLYGIVKASLRLDLAPASNLLSLLGAFGSMIPDLPAYINENFAALDLFYAGDGVLTLAFVNKEGLPMGMTEVDLMSALAPAPQAAAEEEPAPETPETPVSFLPITLTIAENGLTVSLGDSLVAAIAEAYDGLIDSLVAKASEGLDDFTASLAVTVIKGWLGGDINGVEFFLGVSAEGKPQFDLAVYAVPENQTETVRFIGLTLTYREELTAEERDDLTKDKDVTALKAANEKAIAYAARLQPYIDDMVVTDAGYADYVKAVEALIAEIDAEDPAVKSLMSNGAQLAIKTYDEQEYPVILLTAKLFRERVTSFTSLLDEVKTSDDDALWDSINALFDKSTTKSGITVPAIEESDLLKGAIGEEKLESYLAARSAHEEALALALKAKIEAAAATLGDATDRESLTNALTQAIKEFKPTYDKLSDDKKVLSGYQDYFLDVYTRNLEGVMAEYEAVKATLEALTASPETATSEDILAVARALSRAYAWGFGYDNWTSSLSNSTTAMPWGSWVNAQKPAWLEGEEKTALEAEISALNTINRDLSSSSTATMKAFGAALKDFLAEDLTALKAQVFACRVVTDGVESWDFTSFDALEKSEQTAALDKLHAYRFLLFKLPSAERNAIWAEDEELASFADFLSKWENALGDHLAE